LCPEIAVDGDNVTIRTNLQFEGGTARDHTAVRQGIERYWGRRFGRYRVSVETSAAAAPVTNVVITGSVSEDRDLRGVGGSRGWMRGGLIRMAVGGSDRTSNLAAHEFGHVMGLDHDRIDGNLMSETAGSSAHRGNVEEAIRRCGPDADPSRQQRPQQQEPGSDQ
jgi:hypothetical protein